tara:strand:+ start:1760 stop:2758 length:999 start_codon:yes stop_codon:yes gene_type:complete
MIIEEQASLKNSFAINSRSKYLITIESEDCLDNLEKFLIKNPGKVLVLSEGTNVILPEFYDGVVITTSCNHINKISNAEVKVGSAVNWHYFVNWCIDNDYYGIENLSLIPGSLGAAPIQNIGAYGVEVGTFVKSVRFYDFNDQAIKVFNSSECKFSYRNSIFKNMDILILEITFEFNKTGLNLSYKSIEEYIKYNNIDSSNLNQRQLAEIVQEIRKARLPDPSLIPNVGSFFKNPLIEIDSISLSSFSLDDLIIWESDSGLVKVGAARLIELIKDQIPNNPNISLHANHALVLVNLGNASQKDVTDYANLIKNKVYKTFNIELELEPSIIKS